MAMLTMFILYFSAINGLTFTATTFHIRFRMVDTGKFIRSPSVHIMCVSYFTGVNNTGIQHEAATRSAIFPL